MFTILFHLLANPSFNYKYEMKKMLQCCVHDENEGKLLNRETEIKNFRLWDQGNTITLIKTMGIL